ncbi:MAG: ABC transporter ATP-binding protein, partial [Cyanobacteria bacterium P01_H01_bin.15]
MVETAIRLHNLSKVFKRYGHSASRLKELLFPGQSRAQDFWALRNVSIDLAAGQTLGILGRNGSGKSTLLQIIAGILKPTSGEVQSFGRIAALLELGSGFNPEFTGKENIYFNGQIMGFSKRQIAQKYDEIVNFADIGDFIYQPVRTYSSGMFVRLAFAVAVNVDPQILIVDEALSVGDEAFQRKCFARIRAFQEDGRTILFVSHSTATVMELCDRAILMDRGELIAVGNPKVIVSHYQKLLYAPPDYAAELREKLLFHRQQMPPAAAEAPKINATGTLVEPSPSPRLSEDYDPHLRPQSTVSFAPQGAEIQYPPEILNRQKKRVNLLLRRNEYFYQYQVQFSRDSYNVNFGMLIKTISGVELGGAISHLPSQAIPKIEAGKTVTVQFKFRCSLQPGVYFLNAGVSGLIDGEMTFLHRLIDS